MSRPAPKPIASSFDSWLEEEGIQEDVDRAVAKKLRASKFKAAHVLDKTLPIDLR